MPDVFQNAEALCPVDGTWLERLKQAAAGSPRRRARLCLHAGAEDAIQQMVIAFRRPSYVRPHRHPGKIESLHWIEGSVRVVVFDDAGNATRELRLGAPGGGGVVLYRMSAPLWHTVILESESAVLHEVVSGPFRGGDTEFAPWSPQEGDAPAVAQFLARFGG